MKNKIKKEVSPKSEKWEVRYEDEFTISIWKYNSKISRINPYETSIEYKKEKVDKKIVDKKPTTRKKKITT